VGAVTHLALHKWWNLSLSQRTPANGATLVRRNWQSDGFRDAEQAAFWSERAASWVEKYLAELDPGNEPLGVERTVSAPTTALALSGRVDRIDRREGAAVIVDYKTGRKVLTQDDARGSLALAVYAVAARRTLRMPTGRVELHHLPSGTVSVHEHTDESLQRHILRAEAMAEEIVTATDTLESFTTGQTPATTSDASATMSSTAMSIADELFPARPSSACSWCDFRAHCPQGQASSPTLRSWDGLAEVDAAV
jgi:RecB family exonuclease